MVNVIRAMRLADMHAHYPMHVAEGDDTPRTTLKRMRTVRKKPLREKFRACVLRLFSMFFNRKNFWSGSRVTADLMQQGNVRLAYSVMYSPFDEIDFEHCYGAPPDDDYFVNLEREMTKVEEEVARHGPDKIRFVKTGAELDAALESQAVALVHCVEGGFHLGKTPDQIEQNVAQLAERGVAYITLAHLFWRKVATNANALPFLPDWFYKIVFRQPKYEGLSDRGQVAVRAMAEHGIMVDLSHMDAMAIDETFALLDEIGSKVPVISSHAGYRFRKMEYMHDRKTVKRIAEHRGVIGLIMAQHQLRDGVRWRKAKNLNDSLDVICRHIDRIHDITGSHDHVALGTDLDGFIKPTMGGIESMADLGALGERLIGEYGEADATKIMFGNAERVLRKAWALRPVGAASAV